MFVMVYIPSVKNNQYDDYATRETKNNYDPFHVGSINRTNAAVGNTNSKEVNHKKTLNKKRSSIKKARKLRVNETLISEITGKGQYFNEQI